MQIMWVLCLIRMSETRPQLFSMQSLGHIWPVCHSVSSLNQTQAVIVLMTSSLFQYVKVLARRMGSIPCCCVIQQLGYLIGNEAYNIGGIQRFLIKGLELVVAHKTVHNVAVRVHHIMFQMNYSLVMVGEDEVIFFFSWLPYKRWPFM